MLAVLAIVLPIFALVAIGYFVRLLGWFPQDTMRQLNRYVFLLSLPALLLKVIAETPAGDVLHASFITVTLIALAGTFGLAALAALVFRPRQSLTSAGFAACNINAAIVGLPLCLLSFGPTALAPAALTNILTGCVLLPIVLLLYAGASTADRSPGQVLRKVACNPLFLSCVIGLALSLGGIGLPKFLSATLGTLGSSATPCALVALGMFLYEIPIHRNWPQPLALSMMKLAVHPALVFLLCLLIPLEPQWRNVALLMAATPTASGTFLIVDGIGEDADMVGQTILVSTVLALLSLPVWLYVLG